MTAIRVCPKCKSSYNDPELEICPRDGKPLIEWADDPMIGTVVGDRYQLVEPLGQGGMGMVYLAERLPDELEVAVKIVRPEHTNNSTIHERFLREVRHTTAIESPHVVQILDSGLSEEGRAFMVMEKLEGLTLTEQQRRGPRIPTTDALLIGRDIARALDAAHASGVIHRDLKPDNIMLCDDGAVRVVDFGIAKAFGKPSTTSLERSEPSLTEAHRVIGTPAYMSPELVTKEDLTPASDLYALGVILYEMCVGTPPFFASDPIQTMYRHLHETPKRLREIDPTLPIPGALETLVRELLAKKPEDRPNNAGEVAQKLSTLAEVVRENEQRSPVASSDVTGVWDPGGKPSRKKSRTRTKPRKKRRKIGIGVLVLAGVSALLLGFGGTAMLLYLMR